MATENACNRIKIFKGDDTNWNGEQFLTLYISSTQIDLTGMKAKFILGSFNETYDIGEEPISISLTRAVTGEFSYGPIDGIIQILDTQNRIKTVSNTIPFLVTNKVQDAQDAIYNVEVSPNSPLDIEIKIGYGIVTWGQIQGNIANQTDLQAALYQKVSKIGDTMTGDLTLAQGASVVMPDGKLKDDDGMLQLMGEQYGLKVDTTTGVGAALFTVNGFGEVLTTLDLKDTYSATGSDPVTGKAVAQAISTKQNTLSSAQLTAVNSGIDSTKVAQIATNTQAISDEATARENADNGLQTQIDALSAASDVKDIVGTYAELQAYDTSTLGNNDIIKVLDDSTHDDEPSYYRWSTATQTFTYIGSESAAYTKAQADAKFETITGAAATYATKSELSTGLATKASNADGTTIVDNGSTISTIAVKEQNNSLAIKEWVGTKADYDLIETKDANTLYTITDDPDSQAIVVDSTLSPTSTNPIQNKAVYDALQNVDSLPSQTGHSGEYLTTDGTTASWSAVSGGGIQNESTNTGAIAIGGYNTTVGTNKGTQYTVLIGDSAQASESSTSYPSVVIGYNARGNNGSVAVGRAANSNRTSATYNTAIGARTDADNNGVAIGHYANAYTNAVAIGGASSSSNKTNANGDGAIAIGSKAVAGGAGTIQIGTGTNSTAGTVQIGNYPLLDTTGKIYSDRLPSGGAPTITWHTGNTGNTVTIADTTGASLVNVYKNGVLLRPGVATTNYKFIGGSNKWIEFAETYPISTANSWSIQGRFETGASHADWGAFIGQSGSSDNKCPSLNYNGSANTLIALCGSTGTSWNILNWSIGYTLSNSSKYDVVYGFDVDKYYVKIKPYNSSIYTEFTKASTTKCYASVPWTLLNSLNNSYPSNASVYMPTVKVIVDNATLFDGKTAVLGTDYTNNGCTQESISSSTNDYCVSGTTLTLAEDLLATDTIAVEIY